MSATARPLYSQRSTSPPVRSSPSASLATGIRIFSRFCANWTPLFRNKLDVHLIVDNYSTQKHRKVRRWLAQRPHYHIHYPPTYSSWLNQLERWFGLITQRAIRRGSFSSVKDLIEKIDSFVQHYNRSHRPFVWTATADSILGKISRLCSVISGTRH